MNMGTYGITMEMLSHVSRDLIPEEKKQTPRCPDCGSDRLEKIQTSAYGWICNNCKSVMIHLGGDFDR